MSRTVAFFSSLALVALLSSCGSETTSRGEVLPRGLGKADGTASCVNLCGGQAPAGCFCDEECEAHGDCCSDKAAACDAQPASCDGLCGQKHPSGCFCDAGCALYGDCCEGAVESCASRACQSNEQCAANEYCASAEGSCGRGICQSRPSFCPDDYEVLCGCDDVTYFSRCEAARAGANIAETGACQGLGSCSSQSREVCNLMSSCIWNAGAGQCMDAPTVSCAPMDAEAEAGDCQTFWGFKWDGATCQEVLGCACHGSACGALYGDADACARAQAHCAE